jgi:hypothetical protein
VKVPVLEPINFVTAPLGHGKSVYATRMAFKYLAAGKYVAANYDFVPFVGRDRKGGTWEGHPYAGTPWYHTVWAMSQPGGLKGWVGPDVPDADRWRAYEAICSRALRFEHQEQLYDYRLPGDPNVENRGLLVIDEGALRMNARMWNVRMGQNKQRAKSDSSWHELKDLEFMLHVRKLGWTLLLITQDHKMIDNQYRSLGPLEIRLRNLSKMTLPVINQPLGNPGRPRFIAIHWNMETKMVQRREWYGLDRSAGHFRSNEYFDPTKDRDTSLRQMTPYPDPGAPFRYSPGRRFVAVDGRPVLGQRELPPAPPAGVTEGGAGRGPADSGGGSPGAPFATTGRGKRW